MFSKVRNHDPNIKVMKLIIVITAVAALLGAGCQSGRTQKATLERGWIGGEYKTAPSRLIPKGQSASVYVDQLFPGTPAQEAGLQNGDLILAVSGTPVKRLRHFREAVDAIQPGQRATIQVLRDGEILNLPVTVGRETYQQWRAVAMGLRFSTRLDWLPNPEFALEPIARFQRPSERVELQSAETRLARQTSDPHARDENGVYSAEGWDAWFLIFGMSAHKRILTQEVLGPATAMR
jgi:hypothetical protein